MNYDVLEDYSLIELHSARIPRKLVEAQRRSRPAGLQGASICYLENLSIAVKQLMADIVHFGFKGRSAIYGIF